MGLPLVLTCTVDQLDSNAARLMIGLRRPMLACGLSEVSLVYVTPNILVLIELSPLSPLKAYRCLLIVNLVHPGSFC